jgi:ArsR family transcriptional regulator
MNTEAYHLFFKAFSNPTRLRILSLLRRAPANVTGICRALRLEQSRVSHNLRCLQQCSFVTVHPNGRERTYRIETRTIGPILTAIDKHLARHTGRLGNCGVIVPTRGSTGRIL